MQLRADLGRLTMVVAFDHLDGLYDLGVPARGPRRRPRTATCSCSDGAAVVPSGVFLELLHGAPILAVAASSDWPVARFPADQSRGARPVIPITRNADEKPQAELAPSTISGASAPPMWPRPSLSADPGGSRVGGEMFGRVRVEHRNEQPDRHRRHEAEHDDDRGRDEVADHEQRDRPRDREQRGRVLALEPVAKWVVAYAPIRKPIPETTR